MPSSWVSSKSISTSEFRRNSLSKILLASAWQQAGRSGRRHTDSLAVLIAGNDPVDQYILRHPDYFFAQSPEHAVVDPDNPYVLAKHLKAASFELPLSDNAVEQFGDLAPKIAEVLVEAGTSLKSRDNITSRADKTRLNKSACDI